MEEKRTLKKEEINELIEQYYNLTGDLNRYERLKWRRDFRNADKETKIRAMEQKKFFKAALNATLETLIDQDALPNNTAVAALFNRFVSFKTKWAVSKYLRVIHSNK